MTVEEIKTYVDKIESTPIKDLNGLLLDLNLYDITISKICDALAENINILRKLNEENDQHILDNDIKDLLRKYYLCVHYLDCQSEVIHENGMKGHKIVFAKTPTGKPYFNIDLSKVSKEAYKEVKAVLNSIINEVNMGDNTKVKHYNDTTLPNKVLEFKGFQVRIYTTKLKDNILCVFGLKIKKDDNPKSIKVFLKNRLVMLKGQIDNYRRLVKDPVEKKELLSDSEDILSNIMDILNINANKSEEVELLFPPDEELEQLVPYEEDKEIVASVEETKSTVPKTSKLVKRRTSGLGKETMIRNDIIGRNR